MQQEENYLAQSISQVDADARYDEGVKRLLANKSILAVIMKECVPEYHGCTVRELSLIHILSDRLYGIPPHSRENFPGDLTPARHDSAGGTNRALP